MVLGLLSSWLSRLQGPPPCDPEGELNGGHTREPGGRELAGEHPEDSWPGTENALETDSSLRGGVLGGEGAFLAQDRHPRPQVKLGDLLPVMPTYDSSWLFRCILTISWSSRPA